jgi:hypothetical protein
MSSPSGTPGVPGNCPDVRLGYYDGDGDEGAPGSKLKRPGADGDYAGSTANQPRLVPPAGTSTANEPRPEDFMSGGGEY